MEHIYRFFHVKSFLYMPCNIGIVFFILVSIDSFCHTALIRYYFLVIVWHVIYQIFIIIAAIAFL